MSNGMWILFGVVTFITTITMVFTFMFKSGFYTKLGSGDIKFITHNGSLHRIIHNVKGMKLDQGILVDGEEKKSKFNKWFGLWWVGIPIYAKVHTFPIVKERENPDGTTPEEWIERDKEEAIISSLRFTFPRPYVLQKVELGDRIPIDLLVVAKFQVVDPYIPVFLFKGKFFENAGADLRGAVIDILKKFTLDEFVKKPKGEVNGILAGMKDPSSKFNIALIKQVGLRLVGISIPQYDPSDNDVRAAMNAEAVEKEKAKALAVSTEAKARATERMAAARKAQVAATVAGLATSSGNPDVIARGAADILEMEAATSETSKITTFVKGGASTVIPVGGK
jgi:hypothetical protein